MIVFWSVEFSCSSLSTFSTFFLCLSVSTSKRELVKRSFCFLIRLTWAQLSTKIATMSASDDQTLMNQSNISSIPQTKNVYLIYFFLPFYGILFFLGTFGNGLVITSIVRSSRLRTVTNTYLLNIAIADFLLLLSVPFLIVTVLADGWIFGGTMCKIYFNFIHINQYVSALLLAALSFDRYLAVCHPIRAIEFRTRTKCALIIAGEPSNCYGEKLNSTHRCFVFFFFPLGCWLISIFFICPTWIFANVASEKDVKWLGRRVEK